MGGTNTVVNLLSQGSLGVDLTLNPASGTALAGSSGQFELGGVVSPGGGLGQITGLKLIGTTNVGTYVLPVIVYIPGSDMGLTDPLGTYFYQGLANFSDLVSGGTVHNQEALFGVYACREATGDTGFLYQHTLESRWSAASGAATKSFETYWDFRATGIPSFRPIGWNINRTTGYTLFSTSSSDWLIYNNDTTKVLVEVVSASTVSGTSICYFNTGVQTAGTIRSYIPADGMIQSWGAQGTLDVATLTYSSAGNANMTFASTSSLTFSCTGAGRHIQFTPTDYFYVNAGTDIIIGSTVDDKMFTVGQDARTHLQVISNSNMGIGGAHPTTDTASAKGCLYLKAQTNSNLYPQGGTMSGGVLQVQTDGALYYTGKNGITYGAAPRAAGTVALSGGSALVSTTLVTAASRIKYWPQIKGGTPGFINVDARVAGASFTLKSSNAADTSTIAWEFNE